MTLKKGMQIVGGLILLQLVRIIVETLIFTFVDRTLLTDTIVSSLYTVCMIIIIGFTIWKRKITCNVFPKRFTTSYKVATLTVLLLMIMIPIATKNISAYQILFLIYGAMLTVVFEELIFRGYLWKQLERMKNKKYAYLGTTILFSLWHIGYLDTLIWRTAIFFPNIAIFPIVIAKVITAFLIGLLVGYCRYRNQNVYSSILLHSFINMFSL